MARKNNGATTFIIFVAIVGMVVGGLILAAPPQKDRAPSSTQNQQSSVKEDANLINNSDAAVIGSKDAKVKVVVFSDYQCPYCSKLHESFKGLEDKFGGDLAIEVRNFIIHPQAEMMARAAYAADRQGKFDEAANLIFSKYTEATEDSMVKMAEELKLDTEKFKGDLNSDKAKSVVEKDNSDAQALGLGGTPSVFVNNKYLEDPSTLENTISQALGK